MRLPVKAEAAAARVAKMASFILIYLQEVRKHGVFVSIALRTVHVSRV